MSKMLGRTIALAAVTSCLAPAAASADVLTLGVNPSLNPVNPTVNSNNFCMSPCTNAQESNEAQYGTLASTVNGTITSWSMRTKDNGVSYNLRVLGRVGGSFQGKATSPTPITSTNAVDTLYTSGAVSIPISVGDQLGLQTLGPGNNEPAIAAPMMSPNFIRYFSGPDLADGGSAPGVQLSPWLVPVSAQVRFCKIPDLTGTTVAEATALLSAGDCAAGTQTTKALIFKKKKVKGKSKRKKRKALLQSLRAQDGKVVSQLPAVGATSVPGTPVEFAVNKLEIQKKKKKKKHKK